MVNKGQGLNTMKPLPQEYFSAIVYVYKRLCGPLYRCCMFLFFYFCCTIASCYCLVKKKVLNIQLQLVYIIISITATARLQYTDIIHSRTDRSYVNNNSTFTK